MQIFLKEVKEFIRDPAALFMCLIFPILMVLMLGSFLQQMDISDYKIEDIKLHYTIENSDVLNSGAFEMFLSQADMFEAEKSTDIESSRQLVQTGEITALVTLNGSDIELYCGDNGVSNRALSSVFNSYQQMSAIYKSILQTDPAALADIDITDHDSSGSFVEREGLGVTRSMMDYYAVTILVMTLFFSASGSSDAVNEEKKRHTLFRMLITPKRRIHIFIGTILGRLPEHIGIILSTMIFSVIICGARYCNDILGNLMLILMYFLVSAALISVGYLIGLLINVPGPSVFVPLCWTMLFFSGAFAKPVVIEGFSSYLPPYIIQEASFKLTLFNDYSGALSVTLGSFVIFAVCMSASALIFSKKNFLK